MKTKNLWVFFLTFATILLVSGSVIASEIASFDNVEINGVSDLAYDDISVEAGETITIKVFFTAMQTAANVRLNADIEGQKVDVESQTSSFNIEDGKRYVKTLTIKIPYELKNEVSDDLTLDLKMWNSDFRTEYRPIKLRVQKPSYNAKIMSINSASNIEAGELYPIDIVIKNTGYNNLDELYVSVKISALNIERTAYFGDLESAHDNNDDTETKRFYLQLPFDAKEGIYTLEVTASNEDVSISDAKQIVVNNEISSTIIAASLKKSVAVGDDAEFSLIVANPTNKLKIYRIVTESSKDLETSSNVEVVAVPAGMTKTVTITASPDSKGEHEFNVIVFSGEDKVDSVTLSVYADGKSASGSVVALTIILAIIFLVLVGVLIVLLRKKQEKSDEFGESYY